MVRAEQHRLGSALAHARARAHERKEGLLCWTYRREAQGSRDELSRAGCDPASPFADSVSRLGRACLSRN